MAALTDNRDTVTRAAETAAQVAHVVKNDAVLFAGSMIALDATPEIVSASDTAGLIVVGMCPTYIDNAADGKTVVPEVGLQRYANDTGTPVVARDRGKVAYVVDDQTVSTATGTNSIIAGVIVDVDADGVWIDNRAAAMAGAIGQ